VAKVPQFDVPFRLDPVTGAPAEVEQGSVEEIEQCVEAVLRTIVGTRIDDLDFGIPDETFRQQTPNSSAEVYVAAVEEMEPRARVLGTARIEELATKVVTIGPGEPVLV
jgi:phage baseplate assembly protein W